MFSYKAIFMRAFFICKECKFVFTTLGQATHEIEGCCPSCGEDNIDYAPKEARERFITGIKDELQEFEREISEEEAG